MDNDRKRRNHVSNQDQRAVRMPQDLRSIVSDHETHPRDHPAPDLGRRLFQFAVVADTHLEPVLDDPAPPRSNQRFAAVVDDLRASPPDFVLHLGDVVHPLPGTAERAAAESAARALLQRLPCPIHVTPGNHDVGDKPNDRVPAAMVQPPWLEAFEAAHGPQWRAFDHVGIRFILINDLLLNSNLDAEAAQATWLRQTLADAPGRVFLATHYPLFLRATDEPPLYDNVDEPGRGRLLDLLREHGVEAAFSGHVHVWLWNRVGATDLYGAPAVSFVRRDFAELFRVAPLAEFGREDPEKLGYLRVDVHEYGHRCRLVRLGEPWRPTRQWRWSGLGVNLRHPWCETVELPFNPPTDAFVRKRVRNDYPMLALVDMGLRDLRLPLSDLFDAEIRDRARLLVEQGFRLTAFTPDVPTAEALMALLAEPHRPDTVELIVTAARLAPAIERLAPLLAGAGIRLQLTPLLPPTADSADRAGRHTIRIGFEPRPDAVDAALAPYRREGLQLVAGVTLPLVRFDDAALAEWASLDGIQAALLLDWSADDKDGVRTDEVALADEIARIQPLVADGGVQNLRLFLDTFMAFDRSYHPRAGLIDRRCNPTAAGRILRRALAGQPDEEDDAP